MIAVRAVRAVRAAVLYLQYVHVCSLRERVWLGLFSCSVPLGNRSHVVGQLLLENGSVRKAIQAALAAGGGGSGAAAAGAL